MTWSCIKYSKCVDCTKFGGHRNNFDENSLHFIIFHLFKNCFSRHVCIFEHFLHFAFAFFFIQSKSSFNMCVIQHSIKKKQFCEKEKQIRKENYKWQRLWVTKRLRKFYCARVSTGYSSIKFQSVSRCD